MAVPAGKQIGPIAVSASGKPIVPDNVLNGTFPEVLTAPQYLAPDLAAAAGSDTVVSSLKSAHDRMRTSFDAVRTALRMNDPAMTPEANFIRVKQLSDRSVDDIARQLQSAREAGERTIGLMDDGIGERLAFSDTSRAGEIRNHFKGLKKDERLSLAFNAIDSGDKETLAAILNGPHYLTGFTDDDRATIRNRYAEVHAGDLIERKRIIQKALKINNDAFNSLLGAIGRLFPSEKVKEIADRMQAAQTVRDAIFKS